jgi:hypothetical protein
MGLHGSGARLVTRVPVDEDGPLFSFQRQCGWIGWPDEVLVVRRVWVGVVEPGPEVVRRCVEVGQAGSRPVVPIQLDINDLKPFVLRRSVVRVDHQQRLSKPAVTRSSDMARAGATSGRQTRGRGNFIENRADPVRRDSGRPSRAVRRIRRVPIQLVPNDLADITARRRQPTAKPAAAPRMVKALSWPMSVRVLVPRAVLRVKAEFDLPAPSASPVPRLLRT